MHSNVYACGCACQVPANKEMCCDIRVLSSGRDYEVYT